MIFVDSNIPMYVVGSAHQNKVRALDLIETAIGQNSRLVCNAEVFQEILHRYAAIKRTDAIQPAFDLLHGILDEVFTVGLEDVEEAKQTVLAYSGLSSRDALHVASMKKHGVTRIMTFDMGFDVIPGIEIVGGSVG